MALQDHQCHNINAVLDNLPLSFADLLMGFQGLPSNQLCNTPSLQHVSFSAGKRFRDLFSTDTGKRECVNLEVGCWYQPRIGQTIDGV